MLCGVVAVWHGILHLRSRRFGCTIGMHHAASRLAVIFGIHIFLKHAACKHLAMMMLHEQQRNDEQENCGHANAGQHSSGSPAAMRGASSFDLQCTCIVRSEWQT